MAKKTEPFNNPFSKLKRLPENAPKAPATSPRAPSAVPPPRAAPRRGDDDAALFLEAVGEVAPVRAQKARVPAPPPPAAHEVRLPSEEAESLARLAELVSGDEAFCRADAQEAVEGAVQGFDERVMRTLRAGEFRAQARLDLHGLTQEEAKAALERFVQDARVAGHRCVVVVTGRGLHSEDQVPVLKRGVQSWLTRGRLARQVLAFCTAKPTDGGAGALYVLLRR